MAHWSKIGKDPPRKLLGNRVFALTFASSCSARTRERLATYAPEQVEDKWGFYAESVPTLERAIIPWRRAIDGLRSPLDTCYERRVRASL
jgi:hypothetical protein